MSIVATATIRLSSRFPYPWEPIKNHLFGFLVYQQDLCKTLHKAWKTSTRDFQSKKFKQYCMKVGYILFYKQAMIQVMVPGHWKDIWSLLL